MRYTYEKYVKNKRVDTTTNFNEIKLEDVLGDNHVIVFDNSISSTSMSMVKTLANEADYEAWREAREKDIWLDKGIQKAVDPDHYKGYVEHYQWLEVMSKLPTFKDTDVFCGALELQVRKYLDRRGQKDHGLQELKKARFYLECWIQYLEKGQFFCKDVHNKLN